MEVELEEHMLLMVNDYREAEDFNERGWLMSRKYGVTSVGLRVACAVPVIRRRGSTVICLDESSWCPLEFQQKVRRVS